MSLAGKTDEDFGTAVHETRKSLKRLRATVRLARDELGEETYRRENVAFRDAGRRLGGARDSQVLLETLDALSGRCPHEAPLARVQRFRRTLAGQDGAAQRRLHEGPAVAEVLCELRAARERVLDWHVEREGLDALAPGFRRIYRRGRGAYRTARKAELQGEAMGLAKRLFRKRPRKVVRPLEASGLRA
jgi:CHAD domain